MLGIGLLVLGEPAVAQKTPADLIELDLHYESYTAGYANHGGVGLGYSPMVRAWGFVDRFGMLQATPSVSAVRPERAAQVRAVRILHETVPSGPRTRYALPTGSLYWPAAGGVMLYSPLARYQSYGAGYAVGPYGTADHGIMYKGWSLEN
jgi:hypothetical protein